MRPLSVVKLRMLVRIHFWVFYAEAPPQLANAANLEDVEQGRSGTYEDNVAIF